MWLKNIENKQKHDEILFEACIYANMVNMCGVWHPN